jgi:hypothetical protein
MVYILESHKTHLVDLQLDMFILKLHIQSIMGIWSIYFVYVPFILTIANPLLCKNIIL